MSEGDWNIDGRGDASPSVAGRPVPKLGALYRPAPASVPRLRASLALDALAVPQECRWDRTLDLTGANGQPDALGNETKPNCVQCAALRLIQLWCGDQRKPDAAQVDRLAEHWDMTPYGTYTDEAFARFCRDGVLWGERLVVPIWTVLEADGVAPNIEHLKAAIYLMGGVLAALDMPASAMNYTEWRMPTPGTPDAESVGGHCVLLAGYDLTAFYAISWGRSIPAGQAFIRSRLKQASAFASDAWVRAVGDGTARTPSGLDRDQIRAIGAQIEGV